MKQMDFIYLEKDVNSDVKEWIKVDNKLLKTT